MRLHLLLIPVLLISCALPAFADEISIGSGTSVANNILRPIKPHFEKATGHILTIAEFGPEAAMKGMLEGKFEAAATILTIDESREIVKKIGLASDIPLESTVLGSSKTVVITNKANPVSRLSKEQIKGLLTGKIDSWKAVGGQDQPVLIILGKMTSGITKFYYGKFLDNAAIPKEIMEPNSGIDVRSSVAVIPEAIGIVTASVPDASVKVPDQPEAVSNMYLYTKGAQSAKIKQLLNFIQGPGQAFIKKQ